MSLTNLNLAPMNHLKQPLIDLNLEPTEPKYNMESNLELNLSHLNVRDTISLIDLNCKSKEAEEEENIIFNDVYQNLDEISNSFYGPDTEVFTGEMSLNLLPNGRRRGQAPIPASVKWNKKPNWLPVGWWVDYKVRPGSNSNKMFTYTNFIDPVTGRKFRSKKEVDRYLNQETVIESGNAPAANPNQSQLRATVWGRKGKRGRSAIKVNH